MKREIVCLFVFGLLIVSVISVSGTENYEKNIFGGNDGTLSGYVTDILMNPLAGALVRVYFHGEYEEAYTDHTGYYHVTNIPICYCMKNCTASKQGYESKTVLLGIAENTTHDFALSTSDNLYVGGSGPGNYSSIQAAINNANAYDTVFVFDDSSPYIETLIIDKSINLIGESSETTIIDANEQVDSDVILILSDQVTIQGFTLQNTDFGNYPDFGNGIEIWSNSNFITDNVIKDTKMGIQIGEDLKYPGHENNISNFNNIKDNTITQNDFAGIKLLYSSHNKIIRNNISENGFYGIFLWSDNCLNQIGGNSIVNNRIGIAVDGGSNNSIINNHIVNNKKFGITIGSSSRNYINYNNIYNNRINALVGTESITLILYTIVDKERYFSHSWGSNYWGRSYLIPKPITCIIALTIPTLLVGGFIDTLIGIQPIFFIPFMQFDPHPAKVPFNF